MLIEDLPTPCLLIERNRLEANLERMQEKANQNQAALRPHVKTHKSTALGRRQLARGARGITVAKPGEAEVFVQAGFDDVRIAYSVIGPDKYRRIQDLMARARVSFCVDTPESAHAASAFFDDAGLVAEVLVEVDCGHGRCGVPWNGRQSIELAQLVHRLPGLKLAGILTHAGQAYHGPKYPDEQKVQALRRVAAEERDRMLDLAVHLRAQGAVPDAGRFEISIGSTPSMACFENREQEGFRITEIRPGNYVFYDAMQVALSSAKPEHCALTVLSTVVSRHRDARGERIFIDAGKKILTSDTGFGTDGFGTILHSAQTMKPLPHARIAGLSEEHGWVHVPGGGTLGIGDRVRIVPNHACVSVNTQDRLYVMDGEEVVDTWRVDARGRVQ